MKPARALASRGAERLAELGLSGCGLDADLAPALGWSDFLHRFLLRLGPERAREFVVRAPQALGRDAIRRVESVEAGLALIALRELAGWQDVRASLLGATALAESTLGRALAQEPGAAPGLVVFGLGKLGGRELNFYSDLDLVFARTGDDDGERDELVQVRRVRRLLARLEGGFRVDLRLRPFGASGPPVMSLPAMEAYFQSHGREWERYAWIKARPVAGNRRAGRAFLDRLRPFLYRRYLDYHAVEALREMKRQIAEEAGADPLDLKRGPGGIREVEFVVQAFQLVRGGRTPALTGPRLAGALAAAMRLDLLDARSGRALADAYYFLRRVENRLQAQRLTPVHRLPEDPECRMFLAASLGYEDWPGLEAELATRRRAVRRIFDDIFGPPQARGPERGSGERLWQGRMSDDAIRRLGFADPGAAGAALRGFKASRAVRLMSARGRRALDLVAPELIVAAAAHRDADAVLSRLLGVLLALVRRSAYLALLAERPAARDRLVDLTGRSPWLASRLAATPAVLDELLDPRLAAPSPRARLALQLQAIAAERDPDAAVERLREANESQRLKIAAGLADGSLAPADAERALTVLAELSVRAALAFATARMRERHGALECELLAAGYGKLGSRELGLHSDLDLVFIHAGDAAASAGGLAAETYLARLAQRTISLLSMPTAAGALYTVDTRLRPEGAAGLLLSGFSAWRRYQHEQAWLWERQALLRARPVAGSPRLARAFARERRRLLARPVPAQTLAREIVSMRSRVAASGPRRTENAAALLDGEFLAACWLLAAAPRRPAVVRGTGLDAQLAALARGGSAPEAPRLAASLRTLRAAATRRVLGLEPDDAAERAARDDIRRLWDAEFGSASL